MHLPLSPFLFVDRRGGHARSVFIPTASSRIERRTTSRLRAGGMIPLFNPQSYSTNLTLYFELNLLVSNTALSLNLSLPADWSHVPIFSIYRQLDSWYTYTYRGEYTSSLAVDRTLLSFVFFTPLLL